jgi:hypothetical protein
MIQAKHISDRIKRIRMPRNVLAERAGINRDQVDRLVWGKDVYQSTAQKIENALATEERALLAHLLALHPSAAEPPSLHREAA